MSRCNGLQASIEEQKIYFVGAHNVCKDVKLPRTVGKLPSKPTLLRALQERKLIDTNLSYLLLKLDSPRQAKLLPIFYTQAELVLCLARSPNDHHLPNNLPYGGNCK